MEKNKGIIDARLLDEIESERPSFRGKFHRSLIDDNLNTMEYPIFLRLRKMFITVGTVMAALIIYIITIVGLY